MSTNAKRMLILFFFILCFTNLIFSQGMKQIRPNLYTESEIIDSNSVFYAKVISGKFKEHVLNTKKGDRIILLDNIRSSYTLLKNDFSNLSKRYGSFKILKRVPDAIWGDTIRVNKRNGHRVIVPDMSQMFTLVFDSFVPIDSIISKLRKITVIKYVKGPTIIQMFSTPNDIYYSQQWNLSAVNATQAWDISTGSSGVTLAIVDQGIFEGHTDLQSKIIGSSGTKNSNFHGTLVAGVSGASTNNQIGISSLGWNLTLYDYDIDTVSAEAAIYDAVNTSDVINMSWGIMRFATLDDMPGTCSNPSKWLDWGVVVPYPDPSIRDAIDFATSQGVVCIASAGNLSPNSPFEVPVECNPAPIPYNNYPSEFNGVIAVSATKLNNSVEQFVDGWNYSPTNWMDVSAPGFNILTTDDQGGYSSWDGTSFSAPLVSALAGLIVSLNPNLTVQEITNILETTADKIGQYSYDQNGWNRYMGYGRVNAPKALLEVLNRLASENKSTNFGATANNNGRRLVEDATSYFHEVFASGGEIFYRKRTPWNSWLDPIRLSDGNGNNNYPSISESGGRVYVTWQRYTGSANYDIYFSESTDGGSSWNNKYVLSSTIIGYDPLPVVQAGTNSNYVMVAFRYGTGGPSGIKSYWSYYLTPGPGNWGINTISSIYSYSPTLTQAPAGSSIYFPLAVANSSNNSIEYYYYNTDTWSWTGYTNLSLIVPGSNPVHLTPSITSVPGTSQIHAAWERITNGGASQYDYIIIHRKSTSYNSWPNEYSTTYYSSQEMPSISALAADKVDLIFQRPIVYGNDIYKMRYNGSYWNAPIYIASNARYPSISSGNSNSSKYLWTSGISSPYTVMLSSESLGKNLNIVNPLDYYSRSIAWLDSSGSYLEVKLHPVFVKMKDGTKQRIDIAPVSLDTFNLTLQNSFDLLSSVPLQLSPNTDSIEFDYSVAYNNLNNILNGSVNIIQPVLRISDENNRVITEAKTQNQSISTGQLQEVRKRFSIKLNGSNILQNIKASVRILGLNPKKGVFVSLGNIYDYRNLLPDSTIQIKKLAKLENIEEYTIQNYPNPFNPSTIISYSLPERSQVVIKVFDVLGREVTSLVNEVKERGNYTVTFDASNLSSGIYFYTLTASNYHLAKKMILLR